eukprot:RCo015856
MAGWNEGQIKRIVTGDYALDTDLEKGLKSQDFYANQSKLGRLPIADLNEALDLFLKTAQPLASPEELERTKAVVEGFRAPGGMGQTLYKRLQEHASKWGHSSWLQKWWNHIMYLQWRGANAVNVNYYFLFAEDPGLPVRTSDVRVKELGIQALAGARMLTGILDFRQRLLDGTEPPEGGKVPQCVAMWKYLFNDCRVAAPDQDEFHLYNPNLHNHIVVIRKNKYYTFSVLHADGRRLSTADLAAQLQAVITQAGSEDDLNVGILTADDRDRNLAARKQLLADGNEASLEALQSAILAVCLDDSAPVSREECSKLLWHGDVAARNNRWYDKTVSIVVFRNGKMGCQIEHCMFDGTPTRHLMCSVLENLRAGKVNHGDPKATPNLPVPTQLKFILTTTTVRMIQESGKRFDDYVAVHDLRVLAFQGYGAAAIKKMKCSPDAFAQVAIQYAYYKQFGKQAATYESTNMRTYLHGRTETTRSATAEAGAFLAAISDPKTDKKVSYDLFMKAIAAHSDYIKKASAGKGVDRLFLGLKLCLKPGESDPLFDDPVFVRSKNWLISTSHLAHELVDGWGFAETDPEGVGVGYSVKDQMMQFTVTCPHKARGWSLNLVEYLDQALLEMRALCLACQPTE